MALALLGQSTYSQDAVFLSRQVPPKASSHVDHYDALPLGPVWLLNESAEIVWIAGE